MDKGIYKLIVSGIDGNGFQYISGMLEPERLDSNGFRDVEDLRKEIEWKDTVIAFAQRMQAEAEAERDALLKKYNLISEDAL